MILKYDLGYSDEERGIDYDDDYEMEVDVGPEDVEEYLKDCRLDPREYIEECLDDEERYKEDGIDQMKEEDLYEYIYNCCYDSLVEDEGFQEFMKDKYYDDMQEEKRDYEAYHKDIYSYYGVSPNDFH